MSTKRNSLWGRVLAAFARDENTTPEDLEAASKLNPQARDEGEEGKERPMPQPAPQPQAEEKPTFDAAEMNDRLSRIEDALREMSEGREKRLEEEPVPEPEREEGNALDELEQHLRGQAPQPYSQKEDAVEKPPRDINTANGEANDDDEEDFIEAERGDQDEQQAARDAALDIIDGLKPLIAQLPSGQRKRAADSMAMLLRANLPDRQYAGLMHAQQYGHGARDSDPMMDDEEYGRMIRDKYNPHYKKD